jgi:hypothetical protein
MILYTIGLNNPLDQHSRRKKVKINAMTTLWASHQEIDTYLEGGEIEKMDGRRGSKFLFITCN